MQRILKKEGGNHWLGWILIAVVLFLLISVLVSDSEKDKPQRKNTSAVYSLVSYRPVTITSLLTRAQVRPEYATGYDRDLFPHWSDLDQNGCDTSDDVLASESLVKTTCRTLNGAWYSPYDQVKTTNSSDFDVDHMVPLAEAWGSGAFRFSLGKRERYANDFYPPSLIAVSASSNRSKSDQDPSEWLPENQNYICRYLYNWILIKYRWGLTYDYQEKQAVRRGLSQCRSIKVQPPPRAK